MHSLRAIPVPSAVKSLIGGFESLLWVLDCGLTWPVLRSALCRQVFSLYKVRQRDPALSTIRTPRELRLPVPSSGSWLQRLVVIRTCRPSCFFYGSHGHHLLESTHPSLTNFLLYLIAKSLVLVLHAARLPVLTTTASA